MPHDTHKHPHSHTQFRSYWGQMLSQFLKGFPQLDMLEMTFWFTREGEWGEECSKERQKQGGERAGNFFALQKLKNMQ